MYFKAENIKISIEELVHTKPREAVIKKLHLHENEVKNFQIERMSVDSRFHKTRGIFKVYTVYFTYPHPIHHKSVKREQPPMMPAVRPAVKTGKRPIIIGTGPGGLFTALRLLESGICPIMFERGRDIPERNRDVKLFWNTGELNPDSNVQFGLGGAGTFSDGKLMSRIKSPLSRYVAAKLIEFGAKNSILYDAKPHIGTDRLKNIISDIKEYILRMGGEIHFESMMTDLIIRDGKIQGVIINGSDEYFAEDVFLCIGNSARETFEMLKQRNVLLSPKPFAIGFRVEHPQQMIDRYTYGKYVGHPQLSPAAYRIVYRDTPSARSVYSFCNCPGGLVINASSEKNRLAVNGMSFSRRSGTNANSAIVVSLRKEDFPSQDPLSGMYLQREIEEKAFALGKGNYTVPVMNVSDFLNIPGCICVEPSVKPNCIYEDLNTVLPDSILAPLKRGLTAFCSQYEGFSTGVLSAVETRTSSPVRIQRDSNTFQSVSTQGLYPVGEGAGYAGGIMSSAVDGVRAADAFVEKYNQ